MGGTLFELVDDMQELYELATDPETDPQVLQDTIEGMMGLIEVKSCGYVNLIKQLEMEMTQANITSEMFKSKADVRKNSITRMKEALKMAMQRLEVKELPAGAWTIKLQNNGGQEPLVIDHPESVPDNMTKITVEADKAKIREFLETQEGKKCGYAHIEPRGQHISIK